MQKLFFYYWSLFPHLVQNLAFGLIEAPQDVQIGPADFWGNKDGSGVGRAPVALNAAAEIIWGGRPDIVGEMVCEGEVMPNPVRPAGVEPIVVRGAVPPAILSSDFFNSKITLTARNSNAEYATT